MGANPSKHDAWRPYVDIRLVLVRRVGRTLRPYRGLVLEEKVMENRRYLQVAMWVDDGHPYPHVRVEWVLRRDCWPLFVDPNEYGRG